MAGAWSAGPGMGRQDRWKRVHSVGSVECPAWRGEAGQVEEGPQCLEHGVPGLAWRGRTGGRGSTVSGAWSAWPGVERQDRWKRVHSVGSVECLAWRGEAGQVEEGPQCLEHGVPGLAWRGIVSIATLTVLAYERYIRVVHARVINFSWAWRAITYIWLYSLAWAGAPLLGWNRYILDVHGLGCTVDWKSKDANDSSFVLFLFLGCLVVPLGVIAHCYGHILYSIRMLRCVEDLQTTQVIKILKYEKKLAKMCFLMIFTFLVCWMPYIVICFLVVNGHGHLVTPTISIVSYLFAKSNTVYNPVIYVFMIRKFRRSLLQLLCLRLLRCQRPAKDLPAAGSEMQIRPIVMSQKDGDRPKKKVTFNSSSIIFIITSDESLSVDDSDKTNGSKVDVIQVRPL
ncbi:opsin-3 isoform X2 [Macaca fascicularis]|uniref:opsin-3 isoform X2 n=1 Tax=Macaca fascicularis TaxID=9541 RepID=UPI0032B035EF